MITKKIPFLTCIIAFGIGNSGGSVTVDSDKKERVYFAFDSYIPLLKKLPLDYLMTLVKSDKVVTESILRNHGDFPREVGSEGWNKVIIQNLDLLTASSVMWYVINPPVPMDNLRLGLFPPAPDFPKKMTIGLYNRNDLSEDPSVTTIAIFGVTPNSKDLTDDATGEPLRVPALLWAQAALCAMVNWELDNGKPFNGVDLVTPAVRWPWYALSAASGVGFSTAVGLFVAAKDPTFKKIWMGVAAAAGASCAFSAYWGYYMEDTIIKCVPVGTK
ncbi:MAG: hypothetical protein LBJ92_04285 [Holosporales bacterium]|nr:hypothetical protein [Holosporales bacterium]